MFYVETGARKADALRLTWRHAHLPPGGRGTVHFHQAKEDAPRGVPLTKRARAVLDRIKAGWSDAKPDDKVSLWLDGPGGSLVPVGDVKKTWASVKERAEGADLHVHDLRHTFAPRLAVRGVPLDRA